MGESLGKINRVRSAAKILSSLPIFLIIFFFLSKLSNKCGNFRQFQIKNNIELKLTSASNDFVNFTQHTCVRARKLFFVLSTIAMAIGTNLFRQRQLVFPVILPTNQPTPPGTSPPVKLCLDGIFNRAFFVKP